MDVQPTLARQRGVSMIEVLIALFVLSVGMLGIGALSVVSLSTNQDALFRARATMLANDLADRMRANPTAADDYVAMQADDAGCMEVANPAPCSPAEIAANDLFHWLQAIGSPTGGLPQATATVTQVASGTPSTYRITVSWLKFSDDIVDGDSNGALPSVITLDLQL